MRLLSDQGPAVPDLDRRPGQELRPRAVRVRVAVEDDAPVLVFRGIESRVRQDLDPGVAADPEGLGVQPGLVEGAEILGGVAARPVDEYEMVTESVLEAAGPMGTLQGATRRSGHAPGHLSTLKVDPGHPG